MQFEVPKSPSVYTKTLTDFLGVDFTSITPDVRRGTNLINLINNNGFLETRPGYNIVGHEFGTAASATVNLGVDKPTLTFTSIRKSAASNNLTVTIVTPHKPNSKLKLTADGNDLTISLHTNCQEESVTTGNDLVNLLNYYVTITATNGDKIVTDMPKTQLSGGISKRINGVWNIDKDDSEVFIAHVEDKLYELDSTFNNPVELSLSSPIADVITQQSAIYLNNRLVIFDGKRAISYGLVAGTWQIDYLDEIGYVPTVSINRKPRGMGASSYEHPNLLQKYRIDSFVADGASSVYYLSSPYDDEQPTATILQADGSKVNLSIQSYNHTEGTVTFDTIPPKFDVEGRDSVFIRYKVTTKDSESGKDVSSYINGCTIATTYGYHSNNTRIFVTGNADYPNVDWFSEMNDPTYFPAENYTRVGFQPIINYLKLNDGTLAIQKEISDTDYSIYYRNSVIYNGQEAFPISGGSKAIGCIGKYANANLLNDPLTLTESGVFGVAGSSYGEKFVNERSYFVKKKLLEEPNLKNAIAIVHQGRYYLAINNHVYVADSRYKSRIQEASNSTFQYEWYYWEDVPVRVWFSYNNGLYFGTDSGDIVKFNDSVLNYNIPIKQLYDTAFLDLGSIVQSKTVKRVTVISRPYEDSEYTLSYVTNDDTQEIINKITNQGNFPATLQEKEKIKKIMYVKFRLYNDTPKKMNFFRIGIEYIYSGRYRGE